MPLPAIRHCHNCGAALAEGPSRREGTVTLSVVVPVYNEGGQLRSNLSTIRDAVHETGVRSELIIVDDGSSDNTWEEITALHEAFPEVIGMRLSRNFGKEAALSAGLSSARGDACIVMDSDLQHPPRLIPEMVKLWGEGWDIVEGVKTTRGQESHVNRMGARIFYHLLGRLSGYDLDGASDFKLLDRRVVGAWETMQERNTFFRGMVAWLGYRRIKIPFDVPERTATQSRWSLFDLFQLALYALTAFSSLPLHIVTVLGVLFLFGSFLFGMYALALFFAGRALPGFTTVILLQLMIGGVLMTSLGVIGAYIGRLYEEAKRRPRFVVAEWAADGIRSSESRFSNARPLPEENLPREQ